MTPTQTNTPLETDAIYVRRLRPDDLEGVVALDARIVGRSRQEYFRVKLDMAMKETGVEVSLAAEVDGLFTGFLIARVFYGEFGMTEPAATLEVLGVDPDFRGRGIGKALLRQLRTNLLGLGVKRMQSEVSWDDPALMTFFQHEGFRPAARICIDLDCEEHRRREEQAV